MKIKAVKKVTFNHIFDDIKLIYDFEQRILTVVKDNETVRTYKLSEKAEPPITNNQLHFFSRLNFDFPTVE